MDTSLTLKTTLLFLLLLLLESHNHVGSTRTESSLGNTGGVQRVSSIKIGKSNRSSLANRGSTSSSSKGKIGEGPNLAESTRSWKISTTTGRPNLSSSMTSTTVPLAWATGTPFPVVLQDNVTDEHDNSTKQLKVKEAMGYTSSKGEKSAFPLLANPTHNSAPEWGEEMGELGAKCARIKLFFRSYDLYDSRTQRVL